MEDNLKVAINGFGRVGRNFFKLFIERDPNFEVTVINDPGDNDRLTYLLEHDSAKGCWNHDINLKNDQLIVNKSRMTYTSQPDINQINWNDHDVDLVLEASGQLTTRHELTEHVERGAKFVLATTRIKHADKTLLQGLNHDELRVNNHTILSNATCTTHALAPIVDVIDSNFTLLSGVAGVNHSLTRSQSLQDDLRNSSLRKSRASSESIIPASTPAAELLMMIEPDWAGRLGSSALRVPVKNVSSVVISARVQDKVTQEQISNAFSKATDRGWSSLLAIDSNQRVSSDFVQTPYSCVVDRDLISRVGPKHIQVLGWYDNEWGYSNRLLELIDLISSKRLEG